MNRALVVVDLPFGTYQGNSKVALDSAVRIMKETEADAVKMEGGEEILESVQRILSAGIPVMGHLGLTPQSIHKFGTYTVRAKEEAEAEAKALAAAQFAQYGMPSAPDEMLAGYAEKILADKEQGQKIYEKLYEMKVVEDVKSKIKVTEKAVSADEFAKTGQGDIVRSTRFSEK